MLVSEWIKHQEMSQTVEVNDTEKWNQALSPRQGYQSPKKSSKWSYHSPKCKHSVRTVFHSTQHHCELQLSLAEGFP